MICILALLQSVCALASLPSLPQMSPSELQETFGVDHDSKIPSHSVLEPWTAESDGELRQVRLTLDGVEETLDLRRPTHNIFADSFVYVQRGHNGSSLKVLQQSNKHFDECHFSVVSNETRATISNCDGRLKGVIVKSGGTFVLHPLPERHQRRSKRAAASQYGTHILYKRETTEPADPNVFCGMEGNEPESQEFEFEDAFLGAEWNPKKQADLDVELAIFIDEKLWDKFNRNEGAYAETKLRNYVTTVLNNIQMMYHAPSLTPRLNFKVTRYEIFKSQPRELEGYQHNHGEAQKYLQEFCTYQGGRGRRDWDHAFLMSGYNLHRGAGSSSISGIARLHGMCDIWNTCTLTEGLDFTSVFIGTHELGHSVGMRHDEPYCSSTYIMSASLGPGKVKWSTCSMKDYHKFIDRLDSRGKNCMRRSSNAVVLPADPDAMPGQVFDADDQCALMHGTGYKQITPRQDYDEGLCHMMWCGQNGWGRIITSHPALEGTYCKAKSWCLEGRCQPYGARPTPTAAASASDAARRRPPANPVTVHGGWSSWAPASCSSCPCSELALSVGVSESRRECDSPSPLNGGAECRGDAVRGLVCSRACRGTTSLRDFAARLCAAQRTSRRDWELSGQGRQLSRYRDRACKVFCDVGQSGQASRSYRHFGDVFPDGTSCGRAGDEAYCVAGECLPVRCSGAALVKADFNCPRGSEACALVEATPKPWATAAPKWQSWTAWAACSVTCGAGTQSRSRTCSSGSACPGDSRESQSCQEGACPWAEWGACSASCGGGRRSRQRHCPGGGCREELREDEDCGSESCVRWSAWSSWGSCSRSCGGGRRVRSRHCSGPLCYAARREERREEEPCSKEFCPWSRWSSCSVSCGPGGSRRRNRDCPSADCTASDGRDDSHRESCSSNTPCPSRWLPKISSGATWNAWSSWTSCSASCNGGLKARYRQCKTEQAHVTSDSLCGAGEGVERLSCGEDPCQRRSRYGARWTTWSQWSLCSRSCDGGDRRRVRYCHGGRRNCAGSKEDRESCGSTACASPVLWSLWSSWSFCSATCDGGERRRHRTCLGGDCGSDDARVEACNEDACPSWGLWGSWGSCSRSCGGGGRHRSRRCLHPPCDGERKDREACSEDACPADWNRVSTRFGARRPTRGVWGPWGAWGPCSQTCGYGSRVKTRQCYYGTQCFGRAESKQSCSNSRVCAQWGGWGHWSGCSVSCGSGQRRRLRNCYGVGDCDGERQEESHCRDTWC